MVQASLPLALGNWVQPLSDPGGIAGWGGRLLSGPHLLIKSLGAAPESPASYLGPPSQLAVGPVGVRLFSRLV